MIFSAYVFPGFFFILALSFLFDWLDRKLIARFHGRVGPPWYQSIADFIKLLGKEDITPLNTSSWLAAALPLTAFASVATASATIPVASSWVPGFQGDFIVIMFLLSLPSLLYFLAGWICSGVYSTLGGNRSLLQYFSYEVLFTLAVSGSAIAGNSWTLQEIIARQSQAGVNAGPQILGLCLAILGLIGKLKRAPFDIPKAKSEVVAGPLTEYSGKKLAVWYLSIQVQSLSGIFLLINCFFGGWFAAHNAGTLLLFLLLAVGLQAALSLISAIYARLRIDQLIHLTWRVLIPLTLAQIGYLVLM
jgi:NADH-quinone oxidoreductase subunit H